jgi:hypothetical protein
MTYAVELQVLSQSDSVAVFDPSELAHPFAKFGSKLAFQTKEEGGCASQASVTSLEMFVVLTT